MTQHLTVLLFHMVPPIVSDILLQKRDLIASSIYLSKKWHPICIADATGLNPTFQQSFR